MVLQTPTKEILSVVGWGGGDKMKQLAALWMELEDVMLSEARGEAQIWTVLSHVWNMKECSRGTCV